MSGRGYHRGIRFKSKASEKAAKESEIYGESGYSHSGNASVSSDRTEIEALGQSMTRL